MRMLLGGATASRDRVDASHLAFAPYFDTRGRPRLSRRSQLIAALAVPSDYPTGRMSRWCQVYDAVEYSVVGCWVRQHLPRRRGAWQPRPAERCQVYDPVEFSVVGCWVRHHLPRRREGGAWHRCPARPPKTRSCPVPGLRPRRMQRRGELGPTPPPTSYTTSHVIAKRVPGTGARRDRRRRDPARCQVYDADECSVVGSWIRQHLPRVEVPGTAPGQPGETAEDEIVPGARSTTPSNAVS